MVAGMVGKLHVGSFFSPPLSALTCSPAGQHILSTSVGLAGQAEPYLLSPLPTPLPNLPTPNFLSIPPSLRLNRLIRSAGVGCLRCGCWWGSAQTFSLESHFPVVSSPPSSSCVFQVLSLQSVGGGGGKGGRGFKYKHMCPQQ